MEKNKAIIVMDYINEIIDPKGKFKGKGYADFAIANNTLANVVDAVSLARANDIKVIYVKVGFQEDYSDQPKGSPLFGKAEEFQALKLETWATEFHESLDVRSEDKIVVKNRISPFYNTDLESYLKNGGFSNLYICGVSTDLVVQSAVRDAHDRDFSVTVLSDCCVAGDNDAHETSLLVMSKIAQVGLYTDYLKY